MQSTLTVAYPGREGANTAAACDKLFPGGKRAIALPSWGAVADVVVAGEADFGVLPIESSLVGPVNETHDLLFTLPLSIIAQTVLPIRHCLLGVPGATIEGLRVVRSHPMALDQCRELLARLPQAEAIVAATTADAAKQIADHRDPAEAAIANLTAAETYGLTILADNIGDHAEAYTRFVLVATYTRVDHRESDTWRTAFSFVTDHQPGALHRALEPFARHAIDLVQLVSRPIPKTPFRYRFDAQIAGHPLDALISETLREARARTRRLKVWGSYPAESNGWTPDAPETARARLLARG